MATIYRVKAVWTNFPGAPGYSNFYGTGSGDPVVAATWAAAIAQFFSSIKALLPIGTTITVPGSEDELNSDNGQITDQIAFTAPAPVVGTGSGSFSGTSGGLVSWQTAAFRGGRRVRGRTYLVPLVNTSYDTTGSLGTTTIATIQAAANAYLSAVDGTGIVYSRPTPANPVGAASVIAVAQVPDLAVVMRSRRT